MTDKDPSERLNEIVDDAADPWADAAAWLYAGFIEGKSSEEMAATLLEAGWDADEVDGLLEAARKATRSRRGVVTREDVVRAVGVNDPNSFGDAAKSVTSRGGHGPLFWIPLYSLNFCRGLFGARRMTAAEKTLRDAEARKNPPIPPIPPVM